MYNAFQLASRYIRYWLTAANGRGHGTHSPFVYQFIREVLLHKKNYPAYQQVEQMRSSLLANNTSVTIEDMGAGSVTTQSKTRSIASIARHAAKPKKYGQLLHRMVQYYQPSTILELGTSLGLTSSYLALGNPNARVITMEGAKAVADIAQQNFNELQLKNIELVLGNFDDTLQPTLERSNTFDFIFLDGNHRELPTIDYFNAIIPKTNNNSIIVLDDIHWSAGMEAAWQHCIHHPAVTASIDLFFIGIIVLRREIKEKQEFIIRF